jgi:hypothetical protein
VSNEFSELFAIDVCVGAQILEAFKGLSGGPKEFQQFLARPDNLKVMRHDTDAVQSFLKSYIADVKAQTSATVGGHRVNLPLLPVCWYCRKPGLASSDMHVDGPFNKWKTLWAGPSDEPTVAKIRMLSVALNYNMAFVTRDKPALDKLLLAWFAYIADTRSLHHRFKVPYHINVPVGDGLDVDMPAEIRDPKSCAFEDATVSELGNFYAASTSIEVHAAVLIGEAVSVVDPIRFTWALEPWHGA